MANDNQKIKKFKPPFVNVDKKVYAMKLRDPCWLVLRTKILERDKWRCTSCFNNIEELHVHHNMYTSNDPWKEKEENLFTLCSSCHILEHRIIQGGKIFGFQVNNYERPASYVGSMLSHLETDSEFYNEVMDLFEKRQRNKFPGGKVNP